MKYLAGILGLLLLPMGYLFAHNHWIVADNYHPEPGEPVHLVITSGHNFSEGEFLIDDRLFYTVEVLGSDTTLSRMEVAKDSYRRTGEFRPTRLRPSAIRFVLKKHHQSEPIFWGQTIIYPEKTVAHREEPPSFGSGLEITVVPKDSALVENGTIQCTLLMDGDPVAGTLAITPEDRKTTYLTATTERPAEFELRYPGLYLITASYNGKNCSYTFSAQASEE